VSLDFPVGSKVVEQGRGLDVVIVGYKCSTKQYLVKPTAGGEHGQADYLVSQELLKFKKVVVEEPFETNALDYYGALSPKIFSRFIKERTDSLMLALPKLRFTVKEVERALNFHLNICVLGETSDEADFVIEVSIRPSQLLEREDFIFVDLTYSSPLLNYRKQDLEKTRFLLSKQDVRKIKTAKQTSAEILSPQRQCLICCDLEAVYLVYPCGCYGLCGDCNEKAETRQGCPFCRQPTSTVAHKRDYLKFLAGTKITDHTGPMPDAEAAAASCASSKASTGSKCKVCGTPAKRNCSGCRTVVYCSAACQKSDWKSHKPVCKTHRAVASVNKKKPSK
jgi:hypothetical protein